MAKHLQSVLRVPEDEVPIHIYLDYEQSCFSGRGSLRHSNSWDYPGHHLSPPLLTFLKQLDGMLTIRSVSSMLDCTCNLGNLLLKATISISRKEVLSSLTSEQQL